MSDSKLSIYLGYSLLHSHINTVLSSTVGDFYCKDIYGNYLDANDKQVNRSGAGSHSDLLVCTDHDLIWKNHAIEVIEHDNHVINGGSPIVIPESISAFTIPDCISYKAPLRNLQGKIIGIYGLSYYINEIISPDYIGDEITIIAGSHCAAKVKKLFL